MSPTAAPRNRKSPGDRFQICPLRRAFFNWEALIPTLESWQIDVIMAGMSITAARARRVRFVSSYLRVGQMAIFRKGDELRFSAPALLALTQRRVRFVAGTTGAAYVPRPSAAGAVRASRVR
jgi:ABC-type amino acid transport substrate-binding protein